MENILNISPTTSFSSNQSISSSSSFSSTSKDETYSKAKTNKCVVVILNNEFKKSSQLQSKMKRYENTEANQNSDKAQLKSFNQKENALPEDTVTVDESRGVVKNLRKKFLPDQLNIVIGAQSSNLMPKNRSKSELVNNFQLKKCHSVILNVEPELQTSTKQSSVKLVDKIFSSSNISEKKNDQCNENKVEENKTDEKSNKSDPKDQINELSVFENVHIKEKINKFSINSPNLNSVIIPSDLMRSKKISSLRHPSHDPMKYGGSCNNLIASFSFKAKAISTIKEPNPGIRRGCCEDNSAGITSNDEKSSNTTSDIDASTDESGSDDLIVTSSSGNTSSINNNESQTSAHFTENKFIKLQRYKSELSMQQHELLLNKNNSTAYLDFNPEENFILKKLNLKHPPAVFGFAKKGCISFKQKNLTKSTSFNPTKFEEDYNKIKEAFVSFFLTFYYFHNKD